MTLSTKLFGTAILLFIISTAIIQLVGNMVLTSNMDTILSSVENSMLEMRRASALDLVREIRETAGDALQKDEKSKFADLTAKLRTSIQEMDAVSFSTPDGTVVMSSSKANLRQKIPDAILQKAGTTHDTVVDAGKETLTIHVPLIVNRDDIRFHPEWKIGQIHGILSVAFSTHIINQAIESTRSIHDKAVTHMAVVNIGISIFFVCLMGGLLYLLTLHGLKKPVIRAIRMAQTISRGDLSIRLNLKKRDEIGQLASALDTMAEDLEQKSRAVVAVADGDLTATVALASEDDILGQAISKMSEDLNRDISQVNIAAVQVNSGATQIKEASQSLSQGASEIAASLEETAASMTGINDQAQQNAANAKEASQLTDTARDATELGRSRMDEMIAAMSDITDSSDQIDKIIKTIDDIAFQTNLLALNAAVEAARAGKHGKGFAVVAQEVRNLAARSAKAANETTALIESSGSKVSKGTEIANQTAEALGIIVENVTTASELVDRITVASTEQAQAVSQVNHGLSQIDSATLQNSANAEQTAAAANELSSQSQALQELLSRFKLKNGEANVGDAPQAVTYQPMSLTEEGML